MRSKQLKTVRIFLLGCSVAAWAAAVFLAVVTIKQPRYWPVFIIFPLAAFYLTWLWMVLRSQQ